MRDERILYVLVRVRGPLLLSTILVSCIGYFAQRYKLLNATMSGTLGLAAVILAICCAVWVISYFIVTIIAGFKRSSHPGYWVFVSFVLGLVMLAILTSIICH